MPAAATPRGRAGIIATASAPTGMYRTLCATFILLTAGVHAVPAVGDVAPDFALQTLGGETVRLETLTAKAPVVLVVLRGFPGYQCPMCTQQVHAFVGAAQPFAARGARVVMVYPGPAAQLRARATEFLQDKAWPGGFVFLLDPDYTFTAAYGLRWDAPKETAYPSTFVIDRDGKIQFARISKSHGGRASVAEVIGQLDRMK